MAENQTSTNCEGLCEKIFKAICCVSDSPQSSKPTNPAPTALPLSPDKKMTTTEVFSAEVPIIFNTPANTVIRQGHNQAARVAPNNELVPTRGREAAAPAKAGQREEGNGSDKFSDYIDRTKVKNRTTSSVGGGGASDGGGKSVARLDSFHDKVTNYLNRARIKIRTMSNVGGRSVPIE